LGDPNVLNPGLKKDTVYVCSKCRSAYEHWKLEYPERK